MSASTEGFVEVACNDRRLFKIQSEGAIVFEHNYKFSKRAGLADPTHDSIDEEAEDFFLWVETVWNDRSMQVELASRFIGAPPM